jgi:hypothetical protein
MAPLSSIPIPINYETSLLSDWPTTMSTDSKFRPTPPIKPELTENARTINNIKSVPNKIGIKRNQLFSNDYEEYLNELEKKSKDTSINMNDLAALFAPNSQENSSSSAKENTQGQIVTESPEQENLNKEVASSTN